ncbi:MAG: hypothetical protein Q4F24_08195 [Eubacteriales bacterium]|nr:hypothetical protein [Eubacteriales bacterium]
MNPYELIDRLCDITTMQADIIRKQQAVIMQHGIEIESQELDELLRNAELRMDQVEYCKRRL